MSYSHPSHSETNVYILGQFDSQFDKQNSDLFYVCDSKIHTFVFLEHRMGNADNPSLFPQKHFRRILEGIGCRNLLLYYVDSSDGKSKLIQRNHQSKKERMIKKLKQNGTKSFTCSQQQLK